MYILYLDESGDPNGWDNQDNFVMGGVAVFEGEVYALNKQLDEIQKSCFPGVSIPLAFHAAEIRSGRGRFRNMSPSEREILLGKVYDIIQFKKFPRLVAFATAIHISAAKSSEQVLHDSFEDICQRFNTFLLRQYKLGHQDKGLLIIDKAHEDSYRHLVADFQGAGTQFGYIGNIVDIPYFAGRRDTRMLQLADFCAYAVYRYYESSMNDTSYFNKVLPRFDRRASGQPPDGLKHIINQPCSCEACHWR